MFVWVGAAAACGGLFSDVVQTVEQTGESIVFVVDETSTTMHVEVSYEGPSDEFAWVIPVHGIPTLEVSTKDLFDLLPGATAPILTADALLEGNCSPPGGDLDTDSDADSDADADPGLSGGSIGIVAEQTVGPYETLTLSATNTDELISFLQAHGYGVPNLLADALAPYIGSDMYFVALRLQKDLNAGDLRPLALTYPYPVPVIPISMTRFAAVSDMPLTVYLLGPSRAVPTTYLHVELNPLRLDYWTTETHYDTEVARAADEAGGHAFVTDFSRGSDWQAGLFMPSDDGYPTGGLSNATTASEFVDRLWASGFPPSQDVFDLLRELFPLAYDDTVTQLAYQCPGCVAPFVWDIPFDSAEAIAAFEGFRAQRRETQALIESQPHMTRLRSALSPDEMTMDPQFAFNADMEQTVDQRRSITVDFECDSTGNFYTAPQRVSAGPFHFTAPSRMELDEQTLSEWMRERTEHSSWRVERTSETGLPEVLVDNTAHIVASLGALPIPTPGPDPIDPEDSMAVRLPGEAACGCAASPVGLWTLVVLPLMIALRRHPSRR